MNTNPATKYVFLRLIYLVNFTLLVLLPCSCVAGQNKSNAPEKSIPQTLPSLQKDGSDKYESIKEVKESSLMSVQKASELNDAVISRDVPAVKKLLREKADPNEKDSDGNTPLINAVRSLEMTEPIQPNELPEHRRNKLEREAQEQFQIVEELLKYNADTNLQGNLGSTPLIEASFWVYDSENTIKILTSLIKYKAEINAQNERGFTALINAVYAGKAETVKFLLAQKAKANLKTGDGETALSIAQSRKAADIVRLLRETK